MRAYLLVFNAAQADRKAVQATVDKLDIVVNWFSFFDNAMCLASEMSADDLSRAIRQSFPDLVFMISALDPAQTAGWLPKALWSFVGNPRPAVIEAA